MSQTSPSSLQFASSNRYNVVGEVTVAVLALPTSVSSGYIVSKTTSNGATATPFSVGLESGGLTLNRATATAYRVWQSSTSLATANTIQLLSVSGTAVMDAAPRFYKNGVFDTTTPTNLFGGSGFGPAATNALPLRIGNRDDGTTPFSGRVLFAAVWNRQLFGAEHAELASNPWALFAPRRIWVPVSAGGGGSHDATGAMSAQSATVSGSAAAVATYTSSGAPTAQAATVAGTATHVTTHASSGVLEAQAATVAGSADHSAAGAFSATGALTAQAAVVAGSAAHLTLHTATGALASGSATAAGAAVHYTLHTAAGDLVADAASISGSALHEGDGAEVAKPFTGAGRPRRTRQRVVVEIDGEDFIAESSEEAQAILDQAKEAAEEKAKVAIERATKARNRPTRKVMADARKALELPAISAPDLGGYAEEISRQIEDIYQSAIQTIEVAALLRKRELEEEDDEDILMLL